MKRLLFNNDESIGMDSPPNSQNIDDNKTIKLPSQCSFIKAIELTSHSDIDSYISKKKQQQRRSAILRKFEEQSDTDKKTEDTKSVSLKQKEQPIKKIINDHRSVKLMSIEKESVQNSESNISNKIYQKEKQFKKFTLDNQFSMPKKTNKLKNEVFTIDRKLINSQKELTISNRKVYFPYEPYQVQISYMANVFEALDSKNNALLQSPTGTGKTLCLLASVLTWAQNNFIKQKIKTKIIYMSRTHSQLRQVHKQLQKTCFRPNMAVFASRQQLCIKEQLSQLRGKQKIQACSRGVKLQKKINKQLSETSKQIQIDPKLKEAACKFHKQREQVMQIGRRRLTNTLLDIETMKSIGKEQEFCPYFYPHNVKNLATLFLMPYNYLLDSYLLSNYTDIITDSIIIFDQAHNIAEAACEGRSLILETSHIQGSIAELNHILSSFGSRNIAVLKENFQKQIKFMLRNLEDYKQNFNSFALEALPPRTDVFQRESWQREDNQSKIFNKQKTDLCLFELFCGNKIVDQRKHEFLNRKDYYKVQMKNFLINPLQEIIQYAGTIIQALKETHDGLYSNLQKFIVFASKVHRLIVPFIYQNRENQWLETQINHHRLHIFRNQNNTQIFTFGLKCLVPWLTFEQIKKFAPKSIILTSGTLKPLDMWQKELQLKFNTKLVNKHVINKEQLNAKIICNGPSQIPFTFTFDNLNRNKVNLYKDLIQTIIQICSNIPNGVLLVFPSFRLQNQFRQQLTKSPKRHRLLEFKQIIFQQKNSDTNMQNFRKKAFSSKGALLIMICRGKLSEGIDFPDQMCRAVIIVGIPYPNIKDPFIVEKKNHLQNIAARSNNKLKTIRGQEWYFMGTIRTINQALGRVIRHAGDYGMIFLIDQRYQDIKFQKQLPQWVTECLQSVQSSNTNIYNEIYNYYQNMNIKYKRQQKIQYFQKEEKQRKQSLIRGSQKNSFQILMNNRKHFNQKKRRSNDFL